MNWTANTGTRPSSLKDSDVIHVRFQYPDFQNGDVVHAGKVREREGLPLKGLYWPKDRPVYIVEWRKA